MLSFVALATLPLAALAGASRRDSVPPPPTVFVVDNHDVSPDGFTRSATVIGGTDPGPLLMAQKGDQITVQVINHLTDPKMPLDTSIHWHGIDQKRSNWADGTADVTQCPIRSEESFQYQFNLYNQTGTYWYHSHYAAQYCDGVRGPLVIYDPEDPLADMYDIDDESTVISVADWYHTPSGDLANNTGPNYPNSVLINGKGRYVDGPAAPLSVFNVIPGMRYRFRVLAISCDASFNFTIDGHRMTIIEADGNEVEPVDVDSLRIFAGQRYSVVVTANQDVGNFWIRANPSTGDTSDTFDNNVNMAILRYAGAPEEDPTSEPGPYELPFNEWELHPLIDPAAPGIPEIGKADQVITFATGQDPNGYFQMNNVTWHDPPLPVLLEILYGDIKPSQMLPNGSIYRLERNKVIEINFPNPTIAHGYPHPMHLHGHQFSVVRSAGSNQTNFKNPVRRDVVSMGSKPEDNVTIRFVTDNPGPWFLHCHIDWHLLHGFGALMEEAPILAAQELYPTIPVEWNTLCLPKSGE